VAQARASSKDRALGRGETGVSRAEILIKIGIYPFQIMRKQLLFLK
jgi:hypothetical protein